MTTDLAIPADLQSITTLADTAYGRMLVLTDDIPRGRSLLTTGKAPDHEEIRDLCIQLHARGPEAVAIDCGANFGTHTLAFSRYCRSVNAFEAQPTMAKILTYNVRNNRATAAWPFPLAVGRVDGVTWMPAVDYSERRDYGMMQVQPEDVREGCQVDMIALDSVFADYSRVDLLKIDVEGMESAVLAGAEQLIRRHHPILWVEWFRSDRRVLEAELRALGYADIRTVGINLLAVA